jgi:hypothetical protein
MPDLASFAERQEPDPDGTVDAWRDASLAIRARPERSP